MLFLISWLLQPLPQVQLVQPVPVHPVACGVSKSPFRRRFCALAAPAVRQTADIRTASFLMLLFLSSFQARNAGSIRSFAHDFSVAVYYCSVRLRLYGRERSEREQPIKSVEPLASLFRGVRRGTARPPPGATQSRKTAEVSFPRATSGPVPGAETIRVRIEWAGLWVRAARPASHRKNGCS